MAQKKKLGVGAKCSCYTKYLHPAKTVSERYVNQLNKNVTTNLLCISKEEKIVNRVKRVCVVFRHDDFEPETLSKPILAFPYIQGSAISSIVCFGLQKKDPVFFRPH